jgi:hypothetical protein
MRPQALLVSIGSLFQNPMACVQGRALAVAVSSGEGAGPFPGALSWSKPAMKSGDVSRARRLTDPARRRWSAHHRAVRFARRMCGRAADVSTSKA